MDLKSTLTSAVEFTSPAEFVVCSPDDSAGEKDNEQRDFTHSEDPSPQQ